jgi:hypothetical protein
MRVPRARKPTQNITIQLGRPVRARGVPREDPWWCPVQIAGEGFSHFDSIAGIDSLQALMLAVVFAERVVVNRARNRNGCITSFGVVDSPLFCHSTLVSAAQLGTGRRVQQRLATPRVSRKVARHENPGRV